MEYSEEIEWGGERDSPEVKWKDKPALTKGSPG